MLRVTVSSDSEITFHNVSGTGALEWYSFQYRVNDPEAGQAQIRINDEVFPTNISDLNSRAGRHHEVPVQLRLEPGDINTIRFGRIGSEGMMTLRFSWYSRYGAMFVANSANGCLAPHRF